LQTTTGSLYKQEPHYSFFNPVCNMKNKETSKETNNTEDNKPSLEDWIPKVTMSERTSPFYPTSEEVQGQFNEMNLGVQSKEEKVQHTVANITNDTVQTVPEEQIVYTESKRTTSKQRKESLEEYRQTFLQVPKLENRKPVFVSCEMRDRLDEIARKLGGRKMSVSGFIENLVRHHLEMYQEDIESWKKL